MAILTLDKVDFRAKNVNQDKMNYLMTTSLHQKNIKILYICVIKKVSKCMKQKLIGETGKSIIIVEDFSTLLSIIFRKKYLTNII